MARANGAGRGPLAPRGRTFTECPRNEAVQAEFRRRLTSSQVRDHLGAARAAGLREAFCKRWYFRAETIAKHLPDALTYFNGDERDGNPHRPVARFSERHSP